MTSKVGMYVGVARSRLVVVCDTGAFLDGCSRRTASLRCFLGRLVRLEGVS